MIRDAIWVNPDEEKLFKDTLRNSVECQIISDWLKANPPEDGSGSALFPEFVRMIP